MFNKIVLWLSPIFITAVIAGIRMDHFQSKSTCFNHFDTDKDGQLNLQEFTNLTNALFNSGQLSNTQIETLFNSFKNVQSSGMDENAFDKTWDKWIQVILNPITALVIVDVQNDFVNGSLAFSKYGTAGEDGERVLEPINQLLKLKFDYIFVTYDWHPSNHISFIENVKLRPFHESSPIQDPDKAKIGDTVVFNVQGKPREQILWPAHAVQGSKGAEIHAELKIPKDAINIYKGTNPDIDSYSAFFDNQKLSQTNFHSELQHRQVTDTYFCGLAYDLCAGTSALHANELGYRTVLIEDACAALDKARKDDVTQKLVAGHGVQGQMRNIQGLVDANERRADLGYRLGLKLINSL